MSATGARFMLLVVWRLAEIRLLWAFALDRRTKENVRACLQDVMAEITIMTGGSKPPVMRVHSDQAGEFLSPIVMEWLKQNNIKQTFTSGYDPAANGVAERWIDLVKIKATVFTGCQSPLDGILELCRNLGYICTQQQDIGNSSKEITAGVWTVDLGQV